MESSRTKLAHHSRGRILRMPNAKNTIYGSSFSIPTEEGVARYKIRAFFRRFNFEENRSPCNHYVLSAGRLIPVLYRTKSQHRNEKFNNTVSYQLFSYRFSSPRVPKYRH